MSFCKALFTFHTHISFFVLVGLKQTRDQFQMLNYPETAFVCYLFLLVIFWSSRFNPKLN